jgi:uncharacterized protein YggE
MEEATVTARGEAVVPGKPDEGEWVIALSSLDSTPDAALANVAGRSSKISDLLEELGVPTGKRSTSGMNIREEREYLDGKQVHRGYRAEDLLTVRLEDPTIAGRLIEGSIARAKASVRGPSWWIAPDNPARIEACRRAAVEAKRKARSYAEALGLSLGAVLEIRETSSGEPVFPQPGVGPIALRAMPESSIDVEPGELNVQARVDVTFRVEGGG